MVNQLNGKGLIVLGKDQISTVSENCNLIIDILRDYKVKIKNYDGHKKYVEYINKYNEVEYILFRNISYLGKPHPINKKRIQIPKWFQDFYFDMRPKVSNVRLIGIYRFDDNFVFVEFKIQDYIQNNINNSSAHVDVTDLFQVLSKPIFEKNDNQGNKLYVISRSEIKNHLTTRKV